MAQLFNLRGLVSSSVKLLIHRVVTVTKSIRATGFEKWLRQPRVLVGWRQHCRPFPGSCTVLGCRLGTAGCRCGASGMAVTVTTPASFTPSTLPADGVCGMES